MQPCLCKEHFRQVSNVFGKETAFAYKVNDAECVICKRVIFIEGARRYVTSNANGDASPAPNAAASTRA